MNLRQRRWLELLKDYDVDIFYHPGKANVVVDTLSRKSIGSLRHIKVDKLEMTRDLYQLASLSVRLLDSGDGGVVVQNTQVFDVFNNELPCAVNYEDGLCLWVVKESGFYLAVNNLNPSPEDLHIKIQKSNASSMRRSVGEISGTKPNILSVINLMKELIVRKR
ncbi:hypothetical protein RND71_041009 [Anisodus tanguticus]|uniref:Pol protein n=1 Tax=Anisodus tanguticus TaxID=243964 RepID=A0AAE1UQS6_9SOLA|nr:hypothetical protein RND71_041009 [Anisodus tanguticus]